MLFYPSAYTHSMYGSTDIAGFYFYKPVVYTAIYGKPRSPINSLRDYVR
jgi:hypothetical protein